MLSGSPGNLNDRSIIVDTEWDRRVGDVVHVWMADGTSVDLTVVAVIRQGAGGNGAYVTPANAPGASVQQMLVSASAGAQPDELSEELEQIAEAHGLGVQDRTAWAASDESDASPSAVGMHIVLGISLAFPGVFVIATLAMATRERIGELKTLRLSGATRAQVLRALATESVLVAVFGTVLAFLSCGVLLSGLLVALRQLTGSTVLVLPWGTIGAIALSCAVGSVGVVLTVALGSARGWRVGGA